jgi:hypothetical protein
MSSIGGPKPISDNLLIYLDAGNLDSYAGSDATWYDLSGHDRDFSLAGSPTYDSGNYGSLVFNGTNYGTINYTGIFTEASFSSWFKTTDASNSITIANKGGLTGSPTTTNGISMFTPNWAASTVQVYLNDSTGATKSFLQANISQSIRDGLWHNLTVTYNYNGATSTLISYLDGTARATGTLGEDRSSFFNHTAKFDISRQTVSTWRGNIAQFAMYNKTLSSTEVQYNFNVFRRRFNR